MASGAIHEHHPPTFKRDSYLLDRVDKYVGFALLYPRDDLTADARQDRQLVLTKSCEGAGRP